jgi:NhaP-type Na+/H+ or K+/H+ antiporter
MLETLRRPLLVLALILIVIALGPVFNPMSQPLMNSPKLVSTAAAAIM